MRLTCSQKDLNFALGIVSLAVNSSATLPVLSNILLKASGKSLFFSGTNLEIAINYAIAADIKNEGSITIPARLLTSYTNLLPADDEIEMKLEDAMTLHIKSKSSQTKIKGISPDEFPLIPKVEKEATLEIASEDLRDAIDCTIFSAAVGGSRPVLSGVFMSADKDDLKLVATDSFRLAEKKTKLLKKVEKAVDFIVPVRTLLELGRILGETEGSTVEIYVSKNQILFSIGGVELISRLIEGKFPDYEKIIPKAVRTKVEVPVDSLTVATKRVSLFAKENNNSIKLAATNDGKLQIATDETSIGEEKAELDIKMEGENNKVALNSQYLLDVLGRLKENVSIEMDEKLTPVVVKPLKNADYLYIIMPLKI